MRLFRGMEHIASDGRSVVTVGSFDGVHRGHRVLLGEVMTRAHQRGCDSVVVTFENHPRVENVLTTIDEKVWLLEKLGIDNVVALSFEQICNLEAEEFVRKILVEGLRAECVVVGYDHRFGRDRRGDVSLLRSMGEVLGFEVVEVAEQYADGENVSSTLVRQAVEQGDMRQAHHLLGYPYVVCGKFTEQRYIAPLKGKKLPCDGIYDVMLQIEEESFSAKITVAESKIWCEDFSLLVEGDNVVVHFEC